MQPRLSAVIPSYNRWPMVKDAVESALSQRYPCQEVIVVDDGSTDGSAPLLRQTFGSHIRVLEKPNGGVSTARNLGASMATGDYIAYLDSDDLWEPDHNQMAADAIALTGGVPALIFCDFRRYEMRSESFYPQTNTQLFPRLYRRLTLLQDDIYRADGLAALQCVIEDYPFFPSTFVLHRSLHDDYRWDPAVRYSEDFNFVAKIADRYPMIYIDRPLVQVRMHSSNKSANWRAKLESHMQTLRAAELRALGDPQKLRAVRRALGRRHLSIARQLLLERQPAGAAAHLLSAARYPAYFIDAAKNLCGRSGSSPSHERGSAAEQT
jgi:glycosyltransferase involved in cell wall biosynthesis